MGGRGEIDASPATRWKLRIAAVLWFLLLAGFALCVPILFDLSWIIVAVLVVVALLLGLLVAGIVRRLFTGQRRRPWGVSYLKASLGVLFVLVEKALSDGYVIYYEGVRPSPEGDKWFADTLAGGGDLSANYKMLSDVCGLHFQLDYFQMLAADMQARPDRHVNADVTTADMMREYQRLAAADPGFAQRVQPAKADAESKTDTSEGLSGAVDWLTNGTEGQKRIAGYVCRGFLTWTLGRPSEPSPLDPVILDYRNRALAERIAADPSPLIYMTYGAGHLPGLLKDLQTLDPAWEIKSVKWQRVVEAPDDVTGQLDG